MLEPGTRTSHAAVALAASAGNASDLDRRGGRAAYAAGQPGGARSDKLLWQCRLALDPDARLRSALRAADVSRPPCASTRLRIVRNMFRIRRQRHERHRQSVTGYRGRARNLQGPCAPVPYRMATPRIRPAISTLPRRTDVFRQRPLASRRGRRSRGYAPAILPVPTGKPLSFVYDIADLFKFEPVVPEAFRIAARRKGKLDKPVEMAPRRPAATCFAAPIFLVGSFQQSRMFCLARLEPPEPPPDAVGPAFPTPPRWGIRGCAMIG